MGTKFLKDMGVDLFIDNFPCQKNRCLVLPCCNKHCNLYFNFMNNAADTFSLMTADEIVYLRSLPNRLSQSIADNARLGLRYVISTPQVLQLKNI